VIYAKKCILSHHPKKFGDGSQSGQETSKRQLWVIGLVPINEVDTRSMAGDSENYEITTKMTFMDGLISTITYNIITMRTVTVKK
jgi:hypothetical protein